MSLLRRFQAAILFVSLTVSPISLFAGPGGTGGGDPIENRFTRAGWQIYNLLYRAYPSDMPPINLDSFKKVLADTKVTRVEPNDPRLLVMEEGEATYKPVANFPEKKLILITSRNWLNDPQTVFHEYLGILTGKIPSMDSHYKISSHLSLIIPGTYNCNEPFFPEVVIKKSTEVGKIEVEVRSYMLKVSRAMFGKSVPDLNAFRHATGTWNLTEGSQSAFGRLLKLRVGPDDVRPLFGALGAIEVKDIGVLRVTTPAGFTFNYPNAFASELVELECKLTNQ